MSYSKNVDYFINAENRVRERMKPIRVYEQCSFYQTCILRRYLVQFSHLEMKYRPKRLIGLGLGPQPVGFLRVIGS